MKIAAIPLLEPILKETLSKDAGIFKNECTFWAIIAPIAAEGPSFPTAKPLARDNEEANIFKKSSFNEK
jgi:hypothetical protein